MLFLIHSSRHIWRNDLELAGWAETAHNVSVYTGTGKFVSQNFVVVGEVWYACIHLQSGKLLFIPRKYDVPLSLYNRVYSRGDNT